MALTALAFLLINRELAKPQESSSISETRRNYSKRLFVFLGPIRERIVPKQIMMLRLGVFGVIMLHHPIAEC